MQIVINIDEDEYNNMKSLPFTTFAEDIIINGMPLPKGHRKLIAEPTEKDIAKTIGGQNDFAECIREAVKVVFDNATTIIPADKDGEE